MGIKSTDIKAKEKLVLLIICFYADDAKKECNLTNAQLSELCMMSEKTLIKRLSRLEEKGFVKNGVICV
jgi:DNA-binding HxlR family transcriptional regulator